MDDLDKQKIIVDAWEVWGTVPQMLQLGEECNELCVELNKKYIRGKDNDEALIEEFGDVLSMMSQASFILNQTLPDFFGRLERSMNVKWACTADRIAEIREKRKDEDLG